MAFKSLKICFLVEKSKKKGLKGLQAKIAAREEREKKEKELREMPAADRAALQKKEQEEDELIGATEFINIEEADRKTFYKKIIRNLGEFCTKFGAENDFFCNRQLHITLEHSLCCIGI